jgi:hypothetical protein
MLAMQTEVGPSERYRIDTIYKLKLFAEFDNPKPFEEITRQDVIDFLDRLRKPETVDPLHQWQGSYELNRIILQHLFSWLYYQKVVPHSKRPIPAVMQNIPKLKRKEDSIYKPTDLWTAEEYLLQVLPFCKRQVLTCCFKRYWLQTPRIVKTQDKRRRGPTVRQWISNC